MVIYNHKRKRKVLRKEVNEMLYTITTGFKTDRMYGRTDKVEADNPKEAKKIVLDMLMKEHPDATSISQRAQKSFRK